jgi:hypothetical protein
MLAEAVGSGSLRCSFHLSETEGVCAMTKYEITFRDERGVRQLELDDVQLEDGIYELWRGQDVIERVPADQVEKIEPLVP